MILLKVGGASPKHPANFPKVSLAKAGHLPPKPMSGEVHGIAGAHSVRATPEVGFQNTGLMLHGSHI